MDKDRLVVCSLSLNRVLINCLSDESLVRRWSNGSVAPDLNALTVIVPSKKQQELKEKRYSYLYVAFCGRYYSEALTFKGPSLVILQRECALQVQRRKKLKNPKTFVDEDQCSGCKQCLSLGCPAVTFDGENKVAGIDALLCADCGLCIQICPFGAISLKEE